LVNDSKIIKGLEREDKQQRERGGSGQRGARGKISSVLYPRHAALTWSRAEHRASGKWNAGTSRSIQRQDPKSKKKKGEKRKPRGYGKGAQASERPALRGT